MKNKALFGIITSFGLCAVSQAQIGGDAGHNCSGAGVGVGIGVGVGVGVGANINVVRVPGNVAQGRRVYAAFVVSGSQSLTNHAISPLGGGSSSGITGMPRGDHSGFAQSGSLWTKDYTTVVSVFNPGTNPVTFTSSLAGVVTVPPRGSQSLYFGNNNWLNPTLAPFPFPPGTISPTPSLPFRTDFLVIESPTPLEVVALYRYRDERIDFQDEAMVESSICTMP